MYNGGGETPPPYPPRSALRPTTLPLRILPGFAPRSTTDRLRFLVGLALLGAVSGCALGVPEVPTEGPVARLSRAQRDRNDCITAARASLASDYIIETRAHRIVTRSRRLLVAYATEADRNALIDGIMDHLLEACLSSKGYQEVTGFLFLPPTGEGWSRSIAKRGDSVDVVFTKSVGPPDAAHVALALAGLFDVELRAPGREAAGQKLVADLEGQWTADRFSRVSVETSEATWLGAECIGYRVTTRDRGVPKFEGQTFALGVRGIRCVHPDFPGLQPRKIVDLGYSQRLRQGGVWQVTIDPEVEPFLSSLIFVPLDPTAPVIATLEAYAALLRGLGREAGAADVLTQVESLRRPGGAVFAVAPAERLNSYVVVLLGRGREAEAATAKTLATAYLRTGFRQYLRQRGP
jgi:hypothetical protein